MLVYLLLVRRTRGMTESHEIKRRERTVVTLALVCAGAVGCSGSASSTNPSGPITATNFVGTWVQTDGTRTWTLAAGSSGVGQTTVIQAGGPATFVQSSHPSFGAMSARGGVLGTIII